MPAEVVTANTTAQEVFDTPKTRRAIIMQIIISNTSATEANIQIQDLFTPSVSNGVASPSAQTVDRYVMNVQANSKVDLSFSSILEGIEILGKCQVLADVVETDVDITVAWRYL
jgi:hypothetical protein